MLLNYVGKNIELKEGLKNQAEKKFSKLDKYFSEEIEARVVFSEHKSGQKVEVTVFLPGTILRAEEETDNFFTSIDKALDILERQIRKYKTRLKKRYKNNETIRFDSFEKFAPAEEVKEDDKILRRKEFTLKPMSEEEAIMQMELLNHNFFIFLNSVSEKIEVAYKRKDNNYGIIEVNK